MYKADEGSRNRQVVLEHLSALIDVPRCWPHNKNTFSKCSQAAGEHATDFAMSP